MGVRNQIIHGEDSPRPTMRKEKRVAPAGDRPPVRSFLRRVGLVTKLFGSAIAEELYRNIRFHARTESPSQSMFLKIGWQSDFKDKTYVATS